jgi:hypothetical protein
MTPEQSGQNRGEKQDEKQHEKKQEKGRGVDEKYRRNPLGFVSFALLIIWLGITLLLGNADVFGAENAVGRDEHQWSFFLWGGGVIILLGALTRLMVPRWRRPVVGSFIWGAIWVGAGFGLRYDKWEVIGPIVIIAIGVAILAGRLAPRR